jgi:hypothetical protein
MVLVLVTQSYVFFAVVMADSPASEKYLIVAVTILVFLLITSVLLRTYYAVDGDTLIIVSGPIRRIVDISTITGVTTTRNPISSPALSLDRIRIHYGNGKSIMVSPQDKPNFLKAIRQQIPKRN